MGIFHGPAGAAWPAIIIITSIIVSYFLKVPTSDLSEKDQTAFQTACFGFFKIQISHQKQTIIFAFLAKCVPSDPSRRPCDRFRAGVFALASVFERSLTTLMCRSTCVVTCAAVRKIFAGRPRMIPEMDH